VSKFVLVMALACSLRAQTADEVAAKIAGQVIDAMGGAAKFAGVKSVRIKGRMKFGEGNFGPITVTAKRPNRFRMELTVGPDHVIQAYDGTAGWQAVSGEHNQPPTALTGPSLAHLVDQAANAIGGPLLDREQRHNVVQFAGREPVGGVDCYKLDVTLGSGHKMSLFIDATRFLVIREELPVEVEGKPGVIEETVGDYRQFGPVKMACLFVTRQRGGDEKDSQRLEFDTVEINLSVEDSIFHLPARP
jgi:hypothetical protein